MGAWQFLKFSFGVHLFGTHPLRQVARPYSASPATGSHRVHEEEQNALVAEALG